MVPEIQISLESLSSVEQLIVLGVVYVLGVGVYNVAAYLKSQSQTQDGEGYDLRKAAPIFVAGALAAAFDFTQAMVFGGGSLAAILIPLAIAADQLQSAYRDIVSEVSASRRQGESPMEQAAAGIGAARRHEDELRESVSEVRESYHAEVGELPKIPTDDGPVITEGDELLSPEMEPSDEGASEGEANPDVVEDSDGQRP